MRLEQDINNQILNRKLRCMYSDGASPAELVRYLESVGKRGGQIITLMGEAFGLDLSKTKAIGAWMASKDDARLNRFLLRYMPKPEALEQ